MIFPLAFPDPQYIRRTLNSGYVPPEAFLYLDKNGFIQNNLQVPIIYHTPRHKSDKRFIYQTNYDSNNTLLRYNTTIPKKDCKDRYKKNKKYWWLQENTQLVLSNSEITPLGL